MKFYTSYEYFLRFSRSEICQQKHTGYIKRHKLCAQTSACGINLERLVTGFVLGAGISSRQLEILVLDRACGECVWTGKCVVKNLGLSPGLEAPSIWLLMLSLFSLLLMPITFVMHDKNELALCDTLV